MSVVLVVVGGAIVVAGIAGVVVQLIRGDHGLKRMRGESRETRRAVRRAIRDGHTDNPRIDELAREVIRSSPRLRWAKYFFGLMLMLSVGLLMTDLVEMSQVVRHGLESTLWIGLIVLSIINERRLNGYRGLTRSP